MDGVAGVADRGVVELRRLFHAHPKVAFTELWTAATIVAELRLGYRVRTGPAAIESGS